MGTAPPDWAASSWVSMQHLFFFKALKFIENIKYQQQISFSFLIYFSYFMIQLHTFLFWCWYFGAFILGQTQLTRLFLPISSLLPWPVVEQDLRLTVAHLLGEHLLSSLAKYSVWILYCVPGTVLGTELWIRNWKFSASIFCACIINFLHFFGIISFFRIISQLSLIIINQA